MGSQPLRILPFRRRPFSDTLSVPQQGVETSLDTARTSACATEVAGGLCLLQLFVGDGAARDDGNSYQNRNDRPQRPEAATPLPFNRMTRAPAESLLTI
jgi:hypothetical protein